jgi:hypothetical protein
VSYERRRPRPPERRDGLSREGTRAHEGGIDLAVSGMFVVDETGRVDFGGEVDRPGPAPPKPGSDGPTTTTSGGISTAAPT